MYTYIFVYKPNTQYRPSYKERNFAKILPLFWPIVLARRLFTSYSKTTKMKISSCFFDSSLGLNIDKNVDQAGKTSKTKSE